MFRPDSAPLTPNWKHLPIGYHGRSGTVVGLGHRRRPPVRSAQGARRRRPVVRPVAAARHRGRGRLRRRRAVRAGRPGAGRATSPSTCSASCLSTTGPPATSRPGSTCRSARTSASPSPTSVSPWVVPLAALEAARVATAGPGPEPLPYLDDADRAVGARHRAGGRAGTATTVSRPPYAAMYWPRRRAGAHDGQRRHACAPATCSPRAPSPGPEQGPARRVHRADLGRHRAGRRRATAARAPSSRTATRSRSPPPPRRRDGTRIGFGEVAGRVEPPMNAVRTVPTSPASPTAPKGRR